MAHGNETISDETIIEVFEVSEDPYLTTSEVAERTGIHRRHIHVRLLDLYENGILERKKTGRTVGWWLTDDYSRSD